MYSINSNNLLIVTCILLIVTYHYYLGRREQIIPHLVIPGHRSIVNQTRFSSVHYTLCSSGVEKVVKVYNYYMYMIIIYSTVMY